LFSQYIWVTRCISEKFRFSTTRIAGFISLTGNYAGVSAGQLGEMARQVSATVGTTGQAATTL
jgi:hypothetical protein